VLRGKIPIQISFNYFKIYMVETIVETKACSHCGMAFDITDKDMEFYHKVSPSIADKKYGIPSPTFCPDCRMRRRLNFRNERKLYRRKCDITGKEVISMYSPDSEYKICDKHFWRSDAWDALKYGRAYDMSKTFFSQFDRLRKDTPNTALYNVNSVNSEYANHCLGEKNCYMIFGSYENEDCLYGEWMGRSKSCMDLLRWMYLDTCYECVDTKSCYKLFWGQKCNDCSESYFLYNCSNCAHCVWCINLVNASYCIENTQYTKEDYTATLAEMDFQHASAIEEYSKRFAQRIKGAIHKYSDLVACENVTGDNLESVKDSFHCFDMKDARDCKYCVHVMEMNDVYDAYGAWANASLMYEIVDTGLDESNVAFTIVVYQSTNAYYSVNCHGCHNIFGCIGLRNKEYCILNKQYTKEEYELLVPQIIARMTADGERWEFFPIAISPFAYNESIANDYFPVKKDEAMQRWYHRRERDDHIQIPANTEALDAKNLPEHIRDVGDTIVNNVILCEVSKKPFRIVKSELDFYRKHNLPIPHKHPDIRHAERMKLRNPKKLFDRACDNCGSEIKTSFPPKNDKDGETIKEIIYCEQCYNKEIYW
jgi:hypothetical protein